MKRSSILVAGAAAALAIATATNPLAFERRARTMREGGDKPARKLDQLKSGRGRL